MTCIICHDSTSEPLYDNTYCSCKYEKHASCWIDYVHSNSKLNCPTCRKDLSIKQHISQPIRNLPYTTRMEPIHEEHTQTLTYQEFQDYLSENILTHNSRHIQHRLIQNQSQPESKWKKITKIVLTLSIIVVIVIVIAVLI